MKKYYTYIIYSESANVYYKGFTTKLDKRLNDHNNDLSTYTKGKGPWKLVFVQSFKVKAEAIQREKQLKRQNRKYLEWLIAQPINEVG